MERSCLLDEKTRRKNRLMRSGRVEEAGALSTQIAKEIAKRNKTRLSHVSSANGAKDIWQAVRELMGRGNQAHQVEGIRRRRRRSGIAGAGLSLYARLISHFNITNMVFNYI